MKYLTEAQLKDLDKDELDCYALQMTAEQCIILEMIDEWTAAFTLADNEYKNRKQIKNKIYLPEDSSKIH